MFYLLILVGWGWGGGGVSISISIVRQTAAVETRQLGRGQNVALFCRL